MKKFLSIGILFITACSSTPAVQPPPPPVDATIEAVTSLEITSNAFENEGAIPSSYSCDGENTSPALSWLKPPDGTQSFALIMDDPDAPLGTFVHWVIFNIPSSARGLSPAIPKIPQLTEGSIQGQNSASLPGYMGPCPPTGTHRYFFKLYALDTTLGLTSDAKKDDVLSAMEGHILAEGQLMGTYSH